MLRKIVAAHIMVMVLLSSALVAKPLLNELPPMLNYKGVPKVERLVGLEEELNVITSVNTVPYRAPERDPNRDLGDEVVVGYTWYDYQHNGSMGKMIAVDGEGNAHITWMAAYQSALTPRHMLYNMVYTDLSTMYEENDRNQVDNGTQAGYGQLWLLPEDERAVIFYHIFGHLGNAPNFLGTAQSVDWMYGIGAFQAFYPTPWANIEVIWPKGSIDRRNFSHIIATERRDENVLISRLGYWRGTPNQDFDAWNFGQQPMTVDNSSVISGVTATSKLSNKVAVAWHGNLVENLNDYAAAPGLVQRNNDIRFLISENGENWDWQNAESMTKIIMPRPELVNVDLNAAWGDTFRPYCDIDIAFDPWQGSDQLYGAFAVMGFYQQPIYEGEGNPASSTSEHNLIYFYNAEHDTITMVYNAWYFSRTGNGGLKSRNGGWRLNADRPSIAFDRDEPGKIYVAWVKYPQIVELIGEGEEAFFEWLDNDYVGDTSRMGFMNAEVMVSVSTDYGLTWREPVNVTETIWQGDAAPAPGESMSEAWMSVAEVADGYLHLMYVRDGDAGGIAQEEGVATNSPVIYQKISLEDIPVLDPVADPVPFHNYISNRPQIPVDGVSRDMGMVQPDQAVTVSGEVRPSAGRQLASVVIEYTTNGGEQVSNVNMNSIGNDQYAGQIPGMESGLDVWYRIRATDDQDNETVVPDGWWWSYVVRPEGELRIRDIQHRATGWTVDYSPYRGYEVEVTGVVTTPQSYAMESGAYAIQDAEEQWSGVFLRGIEAELKVGDRIRVQGTVFERDPNDAIRWRWATNIAVTNFEIVETDVQMNPVPIDINDIRTGVGSASWSEPWEGVLVEARDFIIGVPTDEFPSYIPIEDEQSGETAWMTTIGLTEEMMANLGVGDYRNGTEIGRMIGIFTENFNHYAIAPRSGDDFESVDVKDNDSIHPHQFALNAAYPNPFNAQTKVSFVMPRTGFSKLAVYDLAGREVMRVSEGELKVGMHSVTIDAVSLSSGVYMLRLDAFGQSASQKLVLVK